MSDEPLSIPGGFLGWIPAFDGTVDDLLIDARDTQIDGPGKTLGRAGGLLIRPGAWQPYWGFMEFDTADLDALDASGRLDEVILHEMGHVLGIGPSWLLTGRIADLLVDPAYTGRAGVAAYQELGGDRAVPVENDGQLGTVIGHWRESTFGDELMTGFLTGPSQPLSRVTIASLADNGYGVDLGAADPYSLPDALAALRVPHDEDDHLHTDWVPPFDPDDLGALTRRWERRCSGGRDQVVVHRERGRDADRRLRRRHPSSPEPCAAATGANRIALWWMSASPRTATGRHGTVGRVPRCGAPASITAPQCRKVRRRATQSPRRRCDPRGRFTR